MPLLAEISPYLPVAKNLGFLLNEKEFFHSLLPPAYQTSLFFPNSIATIDEHRGGSIPGIHELACRSLSSETRGTDI